MKLTPKFLVVLALAGVLMTYAGCKHHSTTVVPVTDTQIDALSAKTWVATSVTRDTNPEPTYVGTPPFTLNFSGTHGQTTINYTATNRPALSAWPASGTMTFDGTTPATNLTRNDTGAAVAVVYSVSATQLVLHFTYTGTGFSRTTEVAGAWVFTMAGQ